MLWFDCSDDFSDLPGRVFNLVAALESCKCKGSASLNKLHHLNTR